MEPPSLKEDAEVVDVANAPDSSTKNSKKKKKEKARDRDSSKDRKKKKERHRSRSRSNDRKEKDKETGKDYDKLEKEDNKVLISQKDKVRDKDKDRDEDKDRNRDRDRRDDRKRSRSPRRRESSSSRDRRRRHRDSRSRSPRRRDRRGDRSRSYSRDRRRDDRDDRRRTSRRDSRSRSRSERRKDRKSRNRSRSEESSSNRKTSSSPARNVPTLRDIMASNPGMSVQEALLKLHLFNAQAQQTASTVSVPMSVALTNVPQSVPVINPLPMLSNIPNIAPVGGALTKAQREIYVGNLPPGSSVPHLTDFLNVAMRQLGVSPNSIMASVVSAWVSTDGHYAFVELRTGEEANAAMAYLSGLQLGTFVLKVGRPKAVGPNGITVPMAALPFTAGLMGLGPQPVGVPTLGGYPMPPLPPSIAHITGMAGIAASFNVGPVDNSPLSNFIMATNIPNVLTDAQVREFFSPFGTIKTFNLIPDAIGITKSHSAVFEYENPAVTNVAIEGLNGMQLMGLRLSLMRVPQANVEMLLKPSAVPRFVPPPVTQVVVPVPSVHVPPNPLLEMPPTNALQLSNMISPEDLRDDELYNELVEDVSDECNSHGTVRSIVIPRPSDAATISGAFSASDIAAGVGKIFVLFVNKEGAQKARAAVHGRSFNGNKVEAVFYPEELLHSKVYAIPIGFDASNPRTWARGLGDDSDNEPLD